MIQEKLKFSVRCRTYGQLSEWKLGVFEAPNKEIASFLAHHKLEEKGIANRTFIISIRKIRYKAGQTEGRKTAVYTKEQTELVNEIRRLNKKANSLVISIMMTRSNCCY